MGAADFGPDAHGFVDALQIAWFDRFLKGIENGVMDEPPVRLAISRSGFEASVPAVEAIPNERALDAHLHVDATGVLRPHAYASTGTPIKDSILDAVQALREAA